eukprot:sb/3472522/
MVVLRHTSQCNSAFGRKGPDPSLTLCLCLFLSSFLSQFLCGHVFAYFLLYMGISSRPVDYWIYQLVKTRRIYLFSFGQNWDQKKFTLLGGGGGGGKRDRVTQDNPKRPNIRFGSVENFDRTTEFFCSKNGQELGFFSHNFSIISRNFYEFQGQFCHMVNVFLSG